jgi:hypothetical protein
MRGGSNIAIAALWAASLVVTATIVWLVASEHFASKAVSTELAVSTPADAGSVEGFRRENAELREEVERLRARIMDRHTGGVEKGAENERLRLVLKQALRQVAEPREPRNDEVSAAWRRGFYALQRTRERGGTFAGIDEGLSLTSDMARFGAAATSFLSGLVMDAKADMKEREMALFVLSHVRDKAALAALVKLRAPDVTELDYPYDLIQLQVSSLSSAEVREFVPEINRRIAQELGAGEQAPERTEVLLTLGLVHGDRESQRLMTDPRILREDLSGAIGLAGVIHTPAARRFLEWVAHNSRNEKQTALATDALASW